MSPNDFRVRPTAEMVRAQVMARISADIPDASVLDLFAGTGALGLEAISRGARRCDFVENRPASLHALKANIVLLGQKGFTRLFKKDALPFAAARPGTAGVAEQLLDLIDHQHHRCLGGAAQGVQLARQAGRFPVVPFS